MDYAFASLEELGDGYGFRKVRAALGVEAFGVKAIVMPPAFEGSEHFVGGKDGYVGRDGQLVDPDDLERRQSFGTS